jgi:hypothetical protein
MVQKMRKEEEEERENLKHLLWFDLYFFHGYGV